MVIRVVKMTFKSEHVKAFLEIFETHKNAIADQPGCTHLDLLHDINNPNVYLTYSIWKTETQLNAYRNSETFGIVWPATKALFAERPVAWSLEEVIKVK